jgi:type IV secretory pathway TrbF-like protein
MQKNKEMIVGDPKKPAPTARQKFLELYAEPVVVNSYLKVTVLVLAAVSIGLLVLLVRTQAQAQNTKPLVIRINDVGHAEAVDYANFAYKPQEADNRYFLSQWARLFYSRNRYTIQKDLTQALYFLNGDLQSAVIEQNKKSKLIESFLLDSGAANVDIEIKNVAIEDLRSAPYKARIEFYKIYTNPMDHTESKRELWTANVVYTFRERVSNEMLLVNPLGLTITYFREDQAFQQ